VNLLNLVKQEIEQKKSYLTSHTSEIAGLREDIISNYNNIVVCMEDDHFEKIIQKYSENVNGIQKQYEDLKLESYTAYEEVMEHPRKMERINSSLQVCLGHIYKLFENSAVVNSVTTSLYSSHVDGNALTADEMRKINECFYGNVSKLL
jgi:uncharacterized coiled-coil DUF342 family protein